MTAKAAGGPAAEPTAQSRPAAIEDPSNLWLVHPPADRLLPLAVRFGIHPNAVSLAGLACGAIAGACYVHWQQPWFVVAGFLAMLAWHVMDGLDGKLARATGQATPFGRLLDGVCDYLVFFFVLIPIALTFPNWGTMLTLCLTAGGFHAAQAAWYEAQRAAWSRRARGDFTTVTPASTGTIFDAGHDWVQARVAGAGPLDAQLAAHPERLGAYLEDAAPLVRGLSLLSANYRTLAIAIACLAGDPRLYWAWEIVGLSLFALVMAARLRSIENRHACMVQSAQGMLDVTAER